MPGPDITGPRNDRAGSVLSWAIWAAIAVSVLTQTFAGQPALTPSYLQSQTVRPPSTQSQSSQPQSPAPAPASPPAISNQQQPSSENGTFVIRKDVDEVLLHVTVVDDKQHIVTDLDRGDFSVF